MARRPRLGQHFLSDTEVVRRILDAAEVGPEDQVLEIGPGRGVLTLPLARRAGRVVAVEVDPRLAAALPHRPNLEVVREDVLEVDLAALLAPPPGWKLIANLPYYETTPILERLLEVAPGRIAGMWLMMQREVARRIASRGTRESGALTHFVQYAAEPEHLFDVPPEAFDPPPEVHSSVLTLQVRDTPPVEADPERLFRLVRTAFQSRRKTLRRSLAGLLGDRAPAILEQAGIDPSRRPETLLLEDFARLARAKW